MIYLDNNATTQPAPEAIEAVLEALRQDWANPSSIHRPGQQARRCVEKARQQVADLLGCKAKEIIFTSGATEANNLALRGILAAFPERKVLITTALEHSAVREPCAALEKSGYKVVPLEVSRDGLVDPDELACVLKAHQNQVAVVAIHWINNETGAIQPMAELAGRCRNAKVPFLTDATQAVGKVPCNLDQLPVDALTFSSHKFHGPKGTGGLVLRNRLRLVPQILGGPHEGQRRGGTENTPGIAGTGAAALLAAQFLAGDGPRRGADLRQRLEMGILQRCPDAVVNSAGAPRVWNTTNIGFPGLEAEAILVLLSERGLCAAAGAACSSGSLEPSPVLLAQGIPEAVAHGSVRFSLSGQTTPQEIEQAIEIVPQAIAKLRRAMPVG